MTTRPLVSRSLPPFPRFPKLESDERADVVVIGGGITGLSAAYLLAAAGRSVALLERGRCAQIDAIARDERIACGFEWVPGFRHALDRSETAIADSKEDAAAARSLGFDATFVDKVPLFATPGVRFGGQARFHPRKCLAGLARALVARGGRIYEYSAAQEFIDSPLGVKANGWTIACTDVVLATHNPLAGVSNVASATLFQTKLALYTSYVVAGRVGRDQLPDALFWDTADPTTTSGSNNVATTTR